MLLAFSIFFMKQKLIGVNVNRNIIFRLYFAWGGLKYTAKIVIATSLNFLGSTLFLLIFLDFGVVFDCKNDFVV